MRRFVSKFLFLLFAVAATAMLLGLTGCASTDPDNMSVRPWSTPKNWEGGLPSGLTEGR